MTDLRQFEGLAAAIRLLQTGRVQGHSREADLLADAVVYTARRIVPRSEADEVVSDVFLKVCGAKTPMRGDSDRAAHAYLARTTRNAHIDFLRRRARTQRRLARPASADAPDPIDLAVAPEPDAKLSDDAHDRLDSMKDRLRGHIDAYVEEAAFRPAQQELRWHQAQCCVMAVLEKQGAPAIKQALGLSVTDAVLHKWTERGRPVVLAALDRWDGPDLNTEEVAALVFLRELFAARRADAGKLRISRRNSDSSRAAVSPPKGGSSVQYAPHKTGRRGKSQDGGAR